MTYSGHGFYIGFRPITPVVKKLLLINIGVFFGQYVLRIIGIEQWFMLSPYYVLRGCIWQPLTYMFMHAGFGHIFFNMLGLFFFGTSLEDSKGSRWFTEFYLMTGVGAGLVIILGDIISPYPMEPFYRTLGASGAIFGVLTAFAFFWPMQPIYVWGIFPVPAIILVLFFAMIEISALGSMSTVSHLGHVGGLTVALIFLLATEKPDWILFIKSKIIRSLRSHSRPDIRIYKADEKSNDQIQNDKKRMDQILEKAAMHGIDSLTKEERDFLNSISKRI